MTEQIEFNQVIRSLCEEASASYRKHLLDLRQSNPEVFVDVMRENFGVRVWRDEGEIKGYVRHRRPFLANLRVSDVGLSKTIDAIIEHKFRECPMSR